MPILSSSPLRSHSGGSGEAPIYDEAAIERLLLEAVPMEEFGPGSDREVLCFHARSTQPMPELGAWLGELPCPVIAVGTGWLAGSADVSVPSLVDITPVVAGIRHTPLAASILVQHLRASEHLAPEHALVAESLAFAALQSGPEFRRWLAGADLAGSSPASRPPLQVRREGDTLSITLDRPAQLNAINTALRDGLCEAFALARADTSIGAVELSANGRSFSIGGDLAEFGICDSGATGHAIRMARSPAREALAIAPRLAVTIAGAAVGAGIEIAAFAHRIKASRCAWFQLPELKYGLIPGAGGTVSIMRRIGRQRAAWMMLSMKRVRASEALAWGLIDEIA